MEGVRRIENHNANKGKIIIPTYKNIKKNIKKRKKSSIPSKMSCKLK